MAQRLTKSKIEERSHVAGRYSDADPYTKQHSRRFRKTLRELDRIFKHRNCRVLDCGSLNGALSVILKQDHYRVYATDLASVGRQYEGTYKSQGIQFTPLREDSGIPFPNEWFDCVIFAEVIEHLWDSPLTILSECRRVLRPGGVLILTTPNVMRLENKIKFLLNMNIYQDLHRYLTSPRPVLHYREYTKKELSTLLTKYIGLSVERVATFDSVAGRTGLRRAVQRILCVCSFVFRAFRGTILVVASKNVR